MFEYNCLHKHNLHSTWSNSPVFVQLQSHLGVSVGPSPVGVGTSPAGVGEGEGGGLGSGLGVGLGDAFWFFAPVEEEFCHN